jgi:hypothetical protein
MEEAEGKEFAENINIPLGSDKMNARNLVVMKDANDPERHVD